MPDEQHRLATDWSVTATYFMQSCALQQAAVRLPLDHGRDLLDADLDALADALLSDLSQPSSHVDAAIRKLAEWPS